MDPRRIDSSNDPTIDAFCRGDASEHDVLRGRSDPGECGALGAWRDQFEFNDRRAWCRRCGTRISLRSHEDRPGSWDDAAGGPDGNDDSVRKAWGGRVRRRSARPGLVDRSSGEKSRSALFDCCTSGLVGGLRT